MASPVSFEEESEQGTCVWSTACGLPVLLCGENQDEMDRQQLIWEELLGCRDNSGGGGDAKVN